MRYCTKKLYKRTFSPYEAYTLFGQYIGKTFGSLNVLGYNQRKTLEKKKYIFTCKCLKCGNYCDREIYRILYGVFVDCGKCSHNEFSKSKVIDISGKRFGELTVLRRVINADKTHRRDTTWLCKCDCGNEIIVRKQYLSTSKHPSCGCAMRSILRKAKSKDLTNRRFGLLTALELCDDERKTAKNRSNYWRCICDCGKETIVSTSSLLSSETRSCGCKANYSSFWETEIVDVIIEKYNIPYKKQYRLKYQKDHKVRHFSYDCAFFTKTKKIVLECNGTRYHPKTPHQTDKYGKPWLNPYGASAMERYNHDMMKLNFAKTMGFETIVVWDDRPNNENLNYLFSYFDNIMES